MRMHVYHRPPALLSDEILREAAQLTKAQVIDAFVDLWAETQGKYAGTLTADDQRQAILDLGLRGRAWDKARC